VPELKAERTFLKDALHTSIIIMWGKSPGRVEEGPGFKKISISPLSAQSIREVIANIDLIASNDNDLHIRVS
jgi:hypothetical protein